MTFTLLLEFHEKFFGFYVNIKVTLVRSYNTLLCDACERVCICSYGNRNICLVYNFYSSFNQPA
jgi:molybdenum cofactor biosynthesis enzyme MoaA